MSHNLRFQFYQASAVAIAQKCNYVIFTEYAHIPV